MDNGISTFTFVTNQVYAIQKLFTIILILWLLGLLLHWCFSNCGSEAAL